MTSILLALASAALARAGLTPGQAQLVLTGLGALVEELEKLEPADVGKWLASLPKATGGDPDIGGNDRAPAGDVVPQPPPGGEESDPAVGG